MTHFKLISLKKAIQLAILHSNRTKKFSEIDIPSKAGDFRIIDRKVINYLKKFDEKNLYLRGLISFIGFKQKGIKYTRNKRVSGQSKI